MDLGRISNTTWLAIAAAIVVIQALALHFMGQPWICECGTIRLWEGDVSGPENSQHLTDWYTFSHIIHGQAFYLLLWLATPKLPLATRFAIAIGLEATWEIAENSTMVIERYREQALAQGYFGDSIVNSISDTLAAAAGFALARLLPVKASIALAITLELFAGYMIRDNLTLNIIQLIHPVEAISRWQTGM